MPEDFEWDKFDSHMCSDEELETSIAALSSMMVGRVTVEELHLGHYQDEGWCLVQRSCRSDQFDARWDCEITSVVRLPAEMAVALQVWLSRTARLDKEESTKIESANAEIFALLKNIEKLDDKIFQHEFTSDLKELLVCLRHKALRAALALSGRLLELTLKLYLQKAGVSCDPNWMVGKLLEKLAEKDVYTDPSLKNQHNIINQYRIAGVHHKEQTPIPSLNQVLGVVHIICDTLSRALQIDTQGNGEQAI